MPTMLVSVFHGEVKMLEQLKTATLREKVLLGTGYLSVVFGGYVFVIEPLNKKTQQLQKTVQQRQVQLGEMQVMASELLSNQQTHQGNPTQWLSGKVANETLVDGQRVSKTRPLDSTQGKQLFKQLAPLGKVSLRGVGNNQVEVWFWQQ